MAIHKGETPCVLLKIDIAKAFDSVSWPFLLEVLQHLGFGRRWRNWISIALSSASTRILLNGQPGKRICHARGLRQGDPLSPMLFVMVEVLNHLVAWLSDQSRLSEGHRLVGPRVSLYADDLVIFVVPSCDDLELIKAALDLFGLASGLFSNLAKSVAFSLHCTDDQIAAVHLILACRIDTFPCRYLGVPLSVRRLKRVDEQPLIDKIAARIPGWKDRLLNEAGRTVLVRATLSAIPIHTSIALCLSPWALQQIDKLRRAFVWAGDVSVAGCRCRVAWTITCRPKELGGLGISDPRRTGIALRA